MASQRAFLLARPRSESRRGGAASQPSRSASTSAARCACASRAGTASAHRVRLRALTARGLRPEAGPVEVAVPAQRARHGRCRDRARRGPARAAARRCCSSPRRSTAPLARTSVAAATVERPAGSRPPPAAAGARCWRSGSPCSLLALGYEVRTRLRARARDSGLTPAPTPTYGGDRDGKAQGLLPAARRSARREPDGHPPRVPEARASLRAGSGRGRVRRAAGGLRDAERRGAPPALRRRARRLATGSRPRSTGPSRGAPRRATCADRSRRRASRPRSCCGPTRPRPERSLARRPGHGRLRRVRRARAAASSTAIAAGARAACSAGCRSRSTFPPGFARARCSRSTRTSPPSPPSC